MSFPILHSILNRTLILLKQDIILFPYYIIMYTKIIDERREFMERWSKELVRQGMKLVEKELQGMNI